MFFDMQTLSQINECHTNIKKKRKANLSLTTGCPTVSPKTIKANSFSEKYFYQKNVPILYMDMMYKHYDVLCYFYHVVEINKHRE